MALTPFSPSQGLYHTLTRRESFIIVIHMSRYDPAALYIRTRKALVLL